MLTPYFQLNQNDEKLLICIHAPYSNIADAEVYVDKDDFRFYSSPYYLRLHLPGHVIDCDEPLVRYNADNGHFNIELIKLVPGEYFDDLDLIAKFLSPQRNKRLVVKPEIQILSSSTNGNDSSDDEGDAGDDSDEDDSSDEWLINQEVPPCHDSDFAVDDSNKTRYGFANQLYDVFKIVKDEFREIFDVINVEESCNSDRQRLRLETEESQFNDDHYLCDLMESSTQLQEALNYKVDYSLEVHLSDDELDKLKNMGNKEYLLTKEECRTAYLSLIEILYGYAYDQRTTLGETTVESAWTINKLSATLSWLQSFNSVKEVAVCCIRRSLCYPLFRHWQLSLKVLDDTINILKSGNRRILRCLLQVHELFNNSEPRYILNQLYIIDYCIWLQTSKINNKLSKLSAIVSEVKESLNKSDISLDIDVLEIAAYSTLEDDLTDNFGKVHLKDKTSDETTSSSSSSDVDSTDCSDSESDLDSDDDLPPDKKCSVEK